MADILNYAYGGESNDYKWTELAFELMTQGELTVALAGPKGGRVVARGACPRCSHDVDYTFDETIVVPKGPGGTLSTDTTDQLPEADTPYNGAEESTAYVTVPVLCHCREDHTGRPDTSRGCGITFNIELRVA